MRVVMMRDDDCFKAVGTDGFSSPPKTGVPFLSKSVPATVFDLGTFGLSDRRLSPRYGPLQFVLSLISLDI
ncbi:hypothetical protein LSTR_LSTR005132 [Laodelphax striatellus]|uniref:Uncharacterized protein n=1 Tax=Laodelphax striatellus TaxID=195883 RepID=A0A482WPZ2_LAOST|nr:hypothetical protein LSTR_LSTR005132 [Laodelphax striatellus]